MQDARGYRTRQIFKNIYVLLLVEKNTLLTKNSEGKCSLRGVSDPHETGSYKSIIYNTDTTKNCEICRVR